jgi:hypothetical protein
MDQTLIWLRIRTKKKDDVLLPMVLHYGAETLRPAFESIDSVRFSQIARVLKIGEDYGSRLLKKFYPESDAFVIANQLARNYPTHGFIIDRDEAKGQLGLRICDPSAELEKACRVLAGFLSKTDAIGRIVEETTNAQPTQTTQ